MRGWILTRHPPHHWREDAYEMPRYLEAAKKAGIDIRVVNPDQFDLIVTRDDRRSVRLENEAVALPDFLLPRMGAGTTYFALAVIRHLERLGVYCVNGSAGVDMVKDKLYTQQVLAQSDLPFAKTMLAKFPIDAGFVRDVLGFPVVVKTVSGSQGTGVFLSETPEGFSDLMSLVSATSPTANIILQEFIASSRGRDLRVITIGGEAVACMRRVAPPGSFKANISGGGRAEPYAITPLIADLASRASRIAGLDLAGVDLLFDGDGFKICEINSNPGFRGMEAAHAISIPDKVYDYIRGRLERTP